MDTGAWLQGLLSLAWLTGQLSGSLTGLVGGISIGVEESKKIEKITFNQDETITCILPLIVDPNYCVVKNIFLSLLGLSSIVG